MGRFFYLLQIYKKKKMLNQNVACRIARGSRPPRAPRGAWSAPVGEFARHGLIYFLKR